MTAAELKEIFERKYERSDWYKILRENFNVNILREKPVDITSRIKANDYSATAFELGSFNTLGESHLIGLYEIEVPVKVQLHRNRRGLRDLLNKIYRDDVDAALIVFIQGNKWRFSYVSEITVKNKETGRREKKTTDPKRYTYLLGEGERAKTAADRFARIKKSEDLFGDGVTLDALEEAFNVEKMSKAFFYEYRKQYGQFTAHITGEDENSKKVKNASPLFKTTFNSDHKAARDFVKKMMGRIVFLYFLEKKGWLGIPQKVTSPNGKVRAGTWGDGDEFFLSKLFKDSKEKKAFYSNILVPLFFATLNTERKDDHFKINDNLFDNPGYSKLKIPYLNGGLFEEDETMTQFLVFPEELFANLFTFFDQYNFTVYEDSPDEHTVAVDPEMLGHIFENLLEDNKDKGAFYTPKEIVHYMCRESLIEYLYTKINAQTAENIATKELVVRTAIEKLVLQHEAADIIEYDEAILKTLKEVKICDPAIGSGAFPMGLLMEIFYLVETLYYASPDVTASVWKFKRGWEPAKVKEEIIQNSIYGVDIEKGAVDIARLRFWLSLVVEEDTPKPLPNLDYKIVVGNSLLSKFEDEVIDIDWNIKTKNASAVKDIINDQQAKLHLLQSRQHLYFVAKGDKAKLQKEIRDLKIEVLVNQLTLERIAYSDNNQVPNTAFPTEKEKKKAEEVTERIRDYNRTIHKLEAIKKHKTEILDFFDWKLDFPEVMNEKVANEKKIGFDIVISNPPYVTKLDQFEIPYYQNIYKTTQGKKYDLFRFFIEKAIVLNKNCGYTIFIVPDVILNLKQASNLRKFILDTSSVYTVSKAPIDTFDASLEPVIIGFKKLHNLKHIAKFTDLYTRKTLKTVSQEKWYLDDYNFNFSIENESNAIVQKIKKQSLKLSDISIWKKGLGVYSRQHLLNRLPKAEVEKIMSDKPWTKDYKADETFGKELSGKDIFRYKIKWNGKKWLSYGPWLAFQRPIEFFKGDRILVREITKDGRYNVCAAYCKEEYFNNQSIFNGILKPNMEYKIKFLLAIINSTLFSHYAVTTSPKSNRTLFPTILMETIELFPIPQVPINIQNKIEKKVNEIIQTTESQGDLGSSLEQQIDLMVYKLYNLTYEEACIVEGNSEWMTKEEYGKFTIE